MTHVTGIARLVLACAMCIGCSEPEIVPRMRPDCGASATLDGGVTPPETDPVVPDGGPGCSPYHRPMAPAATTEGPDLAPMAFALKQITIDQSAERWRRIGYDLDSVCTDTTAGSGSCTSPSPPVVIGPPEDGYRGIDNVFGRVLSPALLLTAPDLQAGARSDQELGRYDLLIELSHYNGADDDPRVDAIVAQTEYVSATVGGRDGGVPTPAEVCGLRPRWDGTDIAYPGDLAFIDGLGTMPKLRDDRAYVRGGVLVIKLPARAEFDVAGSGRTARIRLTDATVVGTLSADRGRLQNVIVSGRWSIVDILEVLPLFGLCPGVPADDSQRAVLTQLLAMGADIRSDPTSDRMGLTCDAVSFGLLMQGYRVLLGEIVPSSARLTPCPTP